MSPELTWYVLRSTGIVAWLLLTGSVVLGLALRSRLFGSAVRPPWVMDLHRGISGTAVVFTAIHVAAVMIDPWIDTNWVEALVPFVDDWRPWATAPGIVSLHLLLAVQITSLLRQRIGTTWWRRIHFAAVPAWALATWHLVTAGTDVGNVLLGTAVLAGIGIVTFSQTFRAWVPRRRRRRADATAAVDAVPEVDTAATASPSARR